MDSNSAHDHFQGKAAYEHVLEKKSETASEVHGDELPGHYGAFIDSARDMTALAIVFWTISWVLGFSFRQTSFILILLTVLWAFWKTVRSAWQNWSLLERLHRVLKEERYEIEHHREQEREELMALYASKGFSGELLEDVTDVLMADDERLLKVMMEEEMGLNLEHYEHPLKVGIFSAVGALLAGVILIVVLFLLPWLAFPISGVLVMSILGLLSAKLQKNELLPAFIWNGGGGIALFGASYFLTTWIQPLIN